MPAAEDRSATVSSVTCQNCLFHGAPYGAVEVCEVVEVKRSMVRVSGERTTRRGRSRDAPRRPLGPHFDAGRERPPRKLSHWPEDALRARDFQREGSSTSTISTGRSDGISPGGVKARLAAIALTSTPLALQAAQESDEVPADRSALDQGEVGEHDEHRRPPDGGVSEGIEPSRFTGTSQARAPPCPSTGSPCA